MKQRYAFLTQFIGSNYHGSQRQNNAPTIQDELEKAFSLVLRQKVTVVLASRVDAGVHARGMVGHFDLEVPPSPLDRGNLILEPSYIKDAPRMADSKTGLNFHKTLCHLNGVLPKDISVLQITKVDSKFHSLKAATARTYTYRLRVGGQRRPLDESQTTFIYYPEPFDLKRLKHWSNMLVGSHDFSGLAKKSTTKVNPVCKVSECSWRRSDEDTNLFIFKITADHFLYNMIRIIIGTQIGIESGKLSVDSLEKALKLKDRQFAGITAPAHGLCLEAIEYTLPLFDII